MLNSGLDSGAAKGSQTGETASSSPTVLPTLLGDGYTTYKVRANNFLASVVLHAAVGALLFLVTRVIVVKTPLAVSQGGFKVTDLPPYVLPPSRTTSGGGGGGGDRDKLAASRGALPKFSLKPQIVPPAVVVRNPNPKLIVEPTVVVPPEIKMAHLGPLGDPLGIPGPPSNGTGDHGGIGDGSDGGVGPGDGVGVGPGSDRGAGGGVVYRIGGGVSEPKLTYSPDPEFSDEARKAKHQGVVTINVIIGPDGRAHQMRVVRTLGLGLDEKAIEAVRVWKFDPARKDGKPVAVAVNIEVLFRLY